MALIREARIGYAIEELNYTLRKFPNHPKALMLMELAAKLNKTPTLAIPYFEKALKFYPEHR